VTEYDYGGYDPSYSTSYSTTELFQPQYGGPTYTSAGYAPQGTHTQITYQPASSGQQQQQQQQQSMQPQQQQQQPPPQQNQLLIQQSQPNYVPNYPNQGGATGGYNPNYNTYGYRSAPPPMPQAGYIPNPMTQAGYPRQY
jgi:hypothetical protein